MDNRQCDTTPPRVMLDRLSALASLLAAEEVAAAFSSLDVMQQTALFGLFESITVDIGAAIARQEICHD